MAGEPPENRKNPDRKRNAASLANLRKGGGRPKGVPNKTTVALKDAARQYTTEALEALVKVLREGESESARIQAANAILDRGYGKPSTILAGDEDGGAIRAIHEIRIVGVEP